MDQDEMNAKLKDVITHRVKDDLDAAKDAFHQVLQAKMRNRINPPDPNAVTPTDEEVMDDVTTDDQQRPGIETQE